LRGFLRQHIGALKIARNWFSFGSDKEALSGVFEAGTSDNKTNLLFGSSGTV
jgi:hypothetical protein